MKKLAITFILSALFAGTALAGQTSQDPCLSDCQCDNRKVEDQRTFQPLFPEYEAEAPLGG